MNEWWLIGLLALLSLCTSIVLIYPLRRQVMLSLFLVCFLFVFAFTGYYYWGGFAAWQQSIRQQKSNELAQKMLKSIKNPQELIDKLKAKLDDTPNSAKGWFLLGRLYSNQNDNSNALIAFAKAFQFKPENEEFATNYAHSLWLNNNQQFTPKIREIFNQLLIKNPKQADALSMLAMDAFVSHAYSDAISYWQRLLVLAPEQSEEARAIRKAIAKAQERLK